MPASNFFDTADMYGGTDSERFPGQGARHAPQRRRHRDEVRDARKRRVPGAAPRPITFKRAVDASLKRLNIDRIDLYQLHKPDSAVPIADTLPR